MSQSLSKFAQNEPVPESFRQTILSAGTETHGTNQYVSNPMIKSPESIPTISGVTEMPPSSRPRKVYSAKKFGIHQKEAIQHAAKESMGINSYAKNPHHHNSLSGSP